MIIKDFSAKATATIFGKLGNGLERGAALLALETRSKISTQGPPRSTAGNPPHMDTQALIAGYGFQVDKNDLRAAIGADVSYAVDLELGNANMAPRPFIRSTLIEKSDDIAKEICKI